MKTLDLAKMEMLSGGSASAVAGFGCGYALAIGIFAAGFVTGGTAWLVGAAVAGPSCAAAVAITAAGY